MKKIKMALALTVALGLVMSFEVIAGEDDEVTIRVMGMHEKTTDSVTNWIILPEVIKGNSSDGKNDSKQVIEHQLTNDINGAGENFEDKNIPAIDQSIEHEQEQSEIQNDLEIHGKDK